MAFNNWPFTNFQDLNLNWILQKVRESTAQATQAATTVAGYATRLLNIENSDSTQNTRISNIENVNNQQNNRISSIENVNNQQNNSISALEASDAQQDTDIYNASEAALAAQRDAATAIQMANLIAENQMFTCVVNNSVTPVTSSKNYAALQSILVTQKKSINFIYIDANGNEYETALVAVGTNKFRAIFILDRVSSSDVYPVIYIDIMSDDSIVITADSISTGGGGGSAIAAVLYVAQQLTEAQKSQARTNIGAGTGTSIVRVNASDGTITITDPNLNIGEPVTYQYRTIFPIVAVYSNGEYTFDRNQADILSAITRGQLPVVRYHVSDNNNNIYREWVFDYYSYYQEDLLIAFNGLDENGKISRLSWYASTGKATEILKVALPNATGADEGKIPRVNSFGNYELVSIPAAETTSFGT